MVKLPPIKSEPSEYEPDGDTARQLIMINTCLNAKAGGITERYQELDPSVQDENEVESIEKVLCLPEHEGQEDQEDQEALEEELEGKLKESIDSI